jgi:hypothetical protein
MIGQPFWFKACIGMEICIQFPFFFTALYAFQTKGALLASVSSLFPFFFTALYAFQTKGVLLASLADKLTCYFQEIGSGYPASLTLPTPAQSW